MTETTNTQPVKSSGMFLVIEGPDGSGKTTMAKKAVEYLAQWGYATKFTREPGGSAIGEDLRKIIVGNHGHDEEVTPAAALMMLLAGRVQHLKHLVYPWVRDGGIVVCDRFMDSTWVYQAKKHGMEADFRILSHLPCLKMAFTRPDYTIFLDVTPDNSYMRTSGDQAKDNNFNEEGGLAARAQQIGHYRERYKEQQGLHPKAVFQLDANGDQEAVQNSFFDLLDLLVLDHQRKSGVQPSHVPQRFLDKLKETQAWQEALDNVSKKNAGAIP